MPKNTFYNLDEDKREQIKTAFLREFSMHAFDSASITEVVKQLGIAKGSIYQYFNDKLDLFIYLIDECSSVKSKYINHIKRDNYDNFWSYFRELYLQGYQFDYENPLESHFLHNLVQNLNSPSIANLFAEMQQQTVEGFTSMVKKEVDLKLFRNDIPPGTMGFMLYKVGISIQEQLEYEGIINPQMSIRNNSPVYQGKKEILMQTVDHYIQFIRPAFDKS